MKQYYKVLDNKEIETLEFFYNIKLGGKIFIGEPAALDDEHFIYIKAQEEKILIEVVDCIELDLYLSAEEETKLYNYMIQEAQDEPEVSHITSIEDFRELIDELRALYIKYSESELFYNYIKNYIDDIAF